MPMDTTVMKKPTLFWIASALPTRCGGQARADADENCGESATTSTPQASSAASGTALGRPPSQG